MTRISPVLLGRFIIFTILILGARSHADWGLFDAGIYLQVNGGASTYQNVTNFNDSHLGNFYSVSNHTLYVNGGEAKTWKNGGSDVSGATFHYRVYAADQAPGAFTSIPLNYFDELGGGDQVWQTLGLTNDVLAGLSRPGTYRLECYISATGTGPTETRYYSNYGNNFKATFDLNTPSLTVNGVDANYTTTKFFVDEEANDSFPVTVVFQPNAVTNLTDVEVFSNLNRRDYATLVWTNADGIVTEEGIYPRPGNTILAGMTNHYYQALPMQTNTLDREYSLTLYAQKTGAYRLSARYRVAGNTNWFWYSDTAMGRRDHAIVVSPKTAREIVMYEVNTLNMKATNTQFAGRSTFVDLWDGPGADAGRPAWNLDYLEDLGVNWLWFQPIHPYGEDGRHLSAADINTRQPGAGATTWFWNGGAPYEDVNYPFALGSPYAVKNFWEVEPRMSKANTRAAAMGEFTNFVQAADQKGVAIMLDAAFNHSAWDVELGDLGVELFAPAAQSTNEIRYAESRVFSLENHYDQRASSATNIAPAPDRFDFGKWLDVKDIFFGRYAALVPTAAESGNYQNEGDWFDYTKDSPAYFDQITQDVWKYFGAYVPYWLDKTGYLPGQLESGIDGLRCDFGQGLPPQAWEYIINRARAIKWNFVFMAETLDGGAPPYRSNRHFDILNENILFAMKGATQSSDYRSIFESRRDAFGQGLVLLNTVSHDEDNYADPWQAFIRFALCSGMDGAPMLFPGQELGISTSFGYDLMEKNFGKYIPHFKTYNSLMPLWNDMDFGNDQLFPAYAAAARARHISPALRASSRWFLNPILSNDPDPNIFSVAKYETANASPAVSDVVLGFVNLDRDNARANTFGIPAQLGTLLGLDDARVYNVRNLSAFTGLVSDRDQTWLWGTDRTGQDVVSNGVYIALNAVPVSNAGWTNAPYEAQYLKVYDVTAPPALNVAPVHSTGKAYVLGTNATFTWDEVIDPEGGPVHYAVIVDLNGVITTNITADTQTVVSGAFNDLAKVTVQPVNPHQPQNAGGASPQSAPVRLLDPEGDYDADTLSNQAEALAGTDPLDADSVFRVQEVQSAAGPAQRHITVRTEPARLYRIFFTDTGLTGTPSWSAFANPANGIGTWLETNSASTVYTFIDDEGSDTTLGPPANGLRFYRVRVEVP